MNRIKRRYFMPSKSIKCKFIKLYLLASLFTFALFCGINIVGFYFYPSSNNPLLLTYMHPTFISLIIIIAFLFFTRCSYRSLISDYLKPKKLARMYKEQDFLESNNMIKAINAFNNNLSISGQFKGNKEIISKNKGWKIKSGSYFEKKGIVIPIRTIVSSYSFEIR